MPPGGCENTRLWRLSIFKALLSLSGSGQFNAWCGGGSVENGDVADVLDTVTGRLLTNVLRQFLSQRAIAAVKSHLDQFVMAKAEVNFIAYGRCQPRLPQGDHWLKRMGMGTEEVALSVA